MHVGHIRSTVLGDALARIASFLGHEVIRDNHIGDWGTQFGMVIYGWKNLLDRAALERDPIAELVRIYKATNEKAASDPKVREAVREELVKLQAGDPENLAIWKETVDLSMREFERAYQILDIHYDIQRGESFYNDRLPAVVERLLKSKIAEVSEGAVCVFFPDIPELAEKPAIIRKSDGGFNYATTDIATVDYRIQDLKADTVWLVVGAPQILHFKQIIAIARREGYTADFHHITFGSILGENRKLMKTRSGENVPLRDLLEEAVQRARKIIEEKNPDLSEPEKIDIAEKVGIGAVKYYDLSQYRMTDYIFSWERMLSFQGNTAPYLQNAYVRIRSIFRKAGEEFVAPAKYHALGARRTESRAKTLPVCRSCPGRSERFPPEHARQLSLRAGQQLPHVLRGVSGFEIGRAGAQLASGALRIDGAVLHRGLDLLGIGVPEKM